MNQNEDGFETEDVDDALGTRRRVVQPKDNADVFKPKPRKNRPSTTKRVVEETKLVDVAPTVVNNTHVALQHGSGAKVDARTIKTKRAILRSLQSFPVVQNNNHLANSLRTLETIIGNMDVNAPVATTVMLQIDSVHDAIYRLDTACSAASTLHLTQSKTHISENCYKTLVVLLLSALFLVALFAPRLLAGINRY